MPIHAANSSSLSMLFFMAWRNLWRNPIRSLLTVSALAGGLIVIILYSALLTGMTRQMSQHATEISTGHLQLQRQAFIDDRDLYATLPWPYLQQLEATHPQMHFAPRLYAAGLASAENTSTGVMIKAIDPQREHQTTRMLEHIRQGTADFAIADHTASGLPRYNLVIGAQLAKNMQLTPGSELILVTQAADGSIGNALFRVAAILKPLEPNFDRMGVLMSIEAFQQLMYLEKGFHELAIKLEIIDQLDSAQVTLTQQLAAFTRAQPLDPLGGDPVIRNWRQLNPAVSEMLELSQSMMLFVGLIVISLASMGMLNTMLMAVHERTHEFGILLAIGMKRRILLEMVLFESFLLALVSAAVGSAAGSMMTVYLEQDGIDLSHYMPDGYDWAGVVFEPVMQVYLEPSHILHACGLMMTVTLITALIPAWRMARLNPAEVMR